MTRSRRPLRRAPRLTARRAGWALCSALAVGGNVQIGGAQAQVMAPAIPPGVRWVPIPVWPLSRGLPPAILPVPTVPPMTALRRRVPRPMGVAPRVPPPRPLARPTDHLPLEAVAPLPPRGLIAEEILPDFTGLEGREGDFTTLDMGPVDADRADDLVRARVTVSIHAGADKRRLDETAAVAYAACATAGYASAHGFGWLRHIRTTTARSGAGRAAEAIFTLTRDMPEGQAMAAAATIAACDDNGVPSGDGTAN